MNNFDADILFSDTSLLSLVDGNDFSEILMDALNVVEENSFTLDKIDQHYGDCNDDLKEILDSFKSVLCSETEQLLEIIKEISILDKRVMH